MDPELRSGQETYQYMELCRFNIILTAITFVFDKMSIQLFTNLLSRGRDLRPASITSRLQCFYSRGSHHMYTIGPLRVEVSHDNVNLPSK